MTLALLAVRLSWRQAVQAPVSRSHLQHLRGWVSKQNSFGKGPGLLLLLQALTPPPGNCHSRPPLLTHPASGPHSFPTPGRLPGSSPSAPPPKELPALFDFLTSWGLKPSLSEPQAQVAQPLPAGQATQKVSAEDPDTCRPIPWLL